MDDVYKVLTNNQRDGRVQAISFDMDKIEKPRLKDANFKKMYQLRWLRVSYSYLLSGSLHLPNSLRFLKWHGYPLKSLPSKFSAQNLVVLDISSSRVGPQLWNEDQSPVNLKRIDLQFCRYLTEVPNLSQCLNIEHINLEGCGSLVEIPSYFQHLSKLTYLNLSKCYKIKNLPKMPCNLEFLDLSWTRIEELPSSVWSHEKISRLDIRYCEHLKSLPKQQFLKGCKSLCEMWELPRNTIVPELSGTAIKELRKTSIESLGLTAIKLINCKSLVSLPTNIWKLKSLESLDLSGCSKFQHFPEISEAMKHLEESVSLDLSGCSKFQHFPEISEAMKHLEFLNLSGTMVKEVPPSIGNLVALRKLDLGDCKYLEVVHDYLFRLTSLQELDLSSTKIKSLPASIKQASQLSRLCLNDCNSLEYLPELPPLLLCLQAKGCTSLKTVSSSSTALAQGWEKCIFYRGLYERHVFSNCPKLDENARSNIMGDAQLRIMRMATASKFKEDKIEETSYDSNKGILRKRSFVAINVVGMKFQNGSAIKVRDVQ
ncbi:Putative disease resistance TIR-NBS-LRR class protein [Prunus dulcis]|uniref:Disease resistance TIR-NBS-LRR class protein n=1 Tax=Prunus dulcis TaxID=3755 RepID=A0A4Y1S114_PRUDU|nr:Putative disease resistance TIR-NBS-LRR class protein [Prunus dulcis]